MKRTRKKHTRDPHSSYEGIIDQVRETLAYVTDTGLAADPVLRGAALKNVLHGDRVLITLSDRIRARNKRPQARVLKILEKVPREWVGTLYPVQSGFAFHPLRAKLFHNIYVPQVLSKRATPQDIVIVGLSQEAPRRDRGTSWEGEVKKILGAAELESTAFKRICYEYRLPLRFSKEVLREVEAVAQPMSEEEIAKREDLRDLPCFTIDPIDAKDFDDALSLRILKENTYEVGIHIADVNHYVKPGTLLDAEAEARATSVYLIDQVVPMLPERLSNDLCSLRPNEDKLTYSVICVLNSQGEILERHFTRSIVRSKQRFTYDTVKEILQKGEGTYSKELAILNQLAQRRRKQRFEAGALRLESTELNFELDKQGIPLRISPKTTHESHALIEEFMLLANQEVAHVLHTAQKQRVHVLYRSHAAPEKEKLQVLAYFSEKLGYQLSIHTPHLGLAINQLLLTASDQDEEALLHLLTIRSMAKAHYTTKDLPHFGLGMRHYTHFTSPIRRYADIVVHRVLDKICAKNKHKSHKIEESLALHISSQERKAIDAERAYTKHKQTLYMQQHVGKTFSGYVSGLNEWGIFVFLKKVCCEGMVRLSELPEHYVFDAQRLTLYEKRRQKTITIGDTVHVKVLKVRILERQTDLQLQET